MKIRFINTIVILMFLPLLANAQKTIWVKSITGQESKVSWYHNVATDNDNNIYAMANFEDMILFKGDILLESAGGTDVFIAKIDPNGDEVIWGIQISSSENITGKNVCTDLTNNVYVSGSFSGETTFGTISISPEVKFGFFVAKYNSDGIFQWVKQGGNYESSWPASTANCNSMKIDKSGNIYLAATVLGMYDGWIDDASLALEKRYLGKAYYEDQLIQADDFYTGHQSIVLKLSPEGELLWKKVIAMGLSVADLAVDANENTYLTGSLGGKIVFEGKDLESNGYSDIYVMKLNIDGHMEWIKQFGRGKPFSTNAHASNMDFEGGQLIEIDHSGNIRFYGVHFDQAKFEDKVLSSDAFVKKNEFGNLFIAGLNSEGGLQWVKNAEGKGSANFSGMECDMDGNTYVAGRVLGKTTLDGKKAKGTFVAKFDPDGKMLWIDDSESRKITLTGREFVDVSWIGGLALNKTEDYLYSTANVMKTTVENEGLIGASVVRVTTTVESMIAITKVKTHK
jgi:hypothetical protein